MTDAVEIRYNDDGTTIDEIIAKGALHIEQMSKDCWFLGINAEDGSYWQFWIAATNTKHRVEVRHYETVTAEEEERWRQLNEFIRKSEIPK